MLLSCNGPGLPVYHAAAELSKELPAAETIARSRTAIVVQFHDLIYAGLISWRRKFFVKSLELWYNRQN